MSDINLELLGKYLESYGWKYEIHEGEFIILFKGEQSDAEFHLIMSTSENWIGLTIWPFVFLPIGKEDAAIKFICKKNFDLKMVRLGMTEKGEISLCADLSFIDLTEKQFHNALDVLSYYADVLYPELVAFWEKE